MSLEDMNEKRSYTEYVVTIPTTDFTFGFEYTEGVDAVRVLVNDKDALEAGYALRLKNSSTMEIQPAVESGTVRIYRETDIDESLYNFTSGALFEASTIDANFEQILHSQQEVRDQFIKLRTDTFITLKDFQEENLQELKDYVDGVFGMTNPNLFDGITDRMVITADGRSQREVNLDVDVEIEKLKQEVGGIGGDYVGKDEFDAALAEKLDSSALQPVYDNLALKADQTYVDTKIDAIAGGFAGSYETLAEAQAAATAGTIPVHSEVHVSNDPDPTKDGSYTWNGTALVKSNYDPVTQSKKYTDDSIKALPISHDVPDSSEALSMVDNQGFRYGGLGVDGSVSTPLFSLTPEVRGGGFAVVDQGGWLLSEDPTPTEEVIPPWANLKYMLFGDSITQTGNPDAGDFGSSFRHNWWTTAKDRLRAHSFYNFARSGASYREYSGQLLWQKIRTQVEYAIALDYEPDVIFMSCATNDAMANLGSYEDAIAKDITELDMQYTADAMRWAYYTLNKRYPNAQLFTCTPIQLSGVEPHTRQPLYDLLRRMGARYGFTVINVGEECGIAREFEVTGGAGRFLYDGTHPNPAGAIRMANIIVPAAITRKSN